LSVCATMSASKPGAGSKSGRPTAPLLPIDAPRYCAAIAGACPLG
jgi:hypothetical protein